jgi:hypothetical protein
MFAVFGRMDFWFVYVWLKLVRSTLPVSGKDERKVTPCMWIFASEYTIFTTLASGYKRYPGLTEQG